MQITYLKGSSSDCIALKHQTMQKCRPDDECQNFIIVTDSGKCNLKSDNKVAFLCFFFPFDFDGRSQVQKYEAINRPLFWVIDIATGCEVLRIMWLLGRGYPQTDWGGNLPELTVKADIAKAMEANTVGGFISN